MPKMNGIEATMQIRLQEKGKPTPIVALTAGNMSGEKEKCLKAGMDDFMAKPVVKKNLADILNKWLKDDDKPEDEEVFKSKKIEHLDKTWLSQYTTDDLDFKGKFIQLAKKDIDESTKELQKGIVERDLDTLKATGHKLKGTCLTVGLTELSKLAVAFELLDEFDEEYVNKLFDSLLFETSIVNKLLIKEQ